MPAENQVFADGAGGPFGIAFYPPGDEPQWIYVANNNSVVRFPYHNGDLKASGRPQVDRRAASRTATGGHSHARRAVFQGRQADVHFRRFRSNVAEEMDKKTPEDIKAWEAEHGLGACGTEKPIAPNILVTDPGRQRAAARLCDAASATASGMAVNQETGDLWVSTNERDGLGDDLVPDYITRVKEGGFYGWPWYYMGNITRIPAMPANARTSRAKRSCPMCRCNRIRASLEMTFYTATTGVAAFPAEYRGDAFVAAFHGSWNRSDRTGYKVVRVRRGATAFPPANTTIS